MKKHIRIAFLLPIIALLFLASCEKEEIEVSRKLITDTLDINSDGIIDFKLEYYELSTFDVPSSGGSRIAKITPLDENQLLYKTNSGYLFLKEGDEINTTPKENNSWFQFGADLISNTRVGTVYNEFWDVKSDLTEDYILGVKFHVDDVNQIGWLKLDFDIQTGEVYLVDSYLIEADQVIISLDDHE